MTFDFVNQLTDFLQKAQFYLKPWAFVIGIIWSVNLLNWFVGSRLNILGIYPRHLTGLVGIIFSPFLHRDFWHLFFNSIPLFVLGLDILVKEGTFHFCLITAIIMLIGGMGVWLVARKGFHIGASGVISGYFSYIILEAYTQPGIITIVAAALAVYYFGGILIGLFPQEKKTSWESHLFGFIGGIACAFLPIVL